MMLLLLMYDDDDVAPLQMIKTSDGRGSEKISSSS